jgi:oligopeptidase B
MATATEVATPPKARREDDRVVLAGVAPVDWKADCPRQSESSSEALLDPAVPVPDPYGWLRDESRTNPEILDHLIAENAYTETLTSHLEGLRATLYQEMLRAIQETDFTLPRPVGDWYYYTRTFEGKSYTIHCRAPKTSDTLEIDWDRSSESPILPGEEILLDVNELAVGKKYCSTGIVKHSPSHKLLAYSTDFTGGETCQLFVKDCTTGEMVDHDPELEIDGSIRWGANDETIFYLKLDAAHRPFQMYRRRLGRSDQPDELLFEEKDEMFWMGISKSLDGKFLFVEASSKETSEVHYLDLTDHLATLQCVAKRRPKVLYDVEHRMDKWWIMSNVGGLPNMALFTAPAVANCEQDWQLVRGMDGGKALFQGDYDRALDSISCFANHVVASGRQGGLPRVWIARLSANDSVESFEMLAFEEDAHDAGLGTHYEFDADKIVIGYDSLVTPTQSVEISLDDTTKRTVLKERAVPGYDRHEYACDRVKVKSRDGSAEIPVSLVYRKDILEKNQLTGEPVYVHLYGYGSYGSTVEADFRSTRLPLLNRGIVYVIAHVRGGGEMGRQWYEEPNGAKYLCKKNTFNDFVDVAHWLVHERKWTSPEMLSCEGRSAGGLLIGASINQSPELFKTAILGVPFVDVVCTVRIFTFTSRVVPNRCLSSSTNTFFSLNLDTDD